MFRTIVLAGAVAMSLTAPSFALQRSQCQAIAASATLIMTNRQYGVSRYETQRYAFNIRDPDIRRAVQGMIGLAYGVSIAPTDAQKRQAITSFRNRYALRC